MTVDGPSSFKSCNIDEQKFQILCVTFAAVAAGWVYVLAVSYCCYIDRVLYWKSNSTRKSYLFQRAN